MAEEPMEPSTSDQTCVGARSTASASWRRGWSGAVMSCELPVGGAGRRRRDLTPLSVSDTLPKNSNVQNERSNSRRNSRGAAQHAWPKEARVGRMPTVDDVAQAAQVSRQTV